MILLSLSWVNSIIYSCFTQHTPIQLRQCAIHGVEMSLLFMLCNFRSRSISGASSGLSTSPLSSPRVSFPSMLNHLFHSKHLVVLQSIASWSGIYLHNIYLWETHVSRHIWSAVIQHEYMHQQVVQQCVVIVYIHYCIH